MYIKYFNHRHLLSYGHQLELFRYMALLYPALEIQAKDKAYGIANKKNHLFSGSVVYGSNPTGGIKAADVCIRLM